MNKIPHSVRQNLTTQRPVGDHPDADQLAAFSEQRLSEAERENVLVHLGTCADCREIAALAAPGAASATAQPAVVLARSWWSAPSVQWAAAAAAVAIAALGIALLRPADTRNESKMAQVAQPAESSRHVARQDQTRASSDTLARDPSRSELPSTKEAQRPVVRHPGNQSDASPKVASNSGARKADNYSYAALDDKNAASDKAAGLEKNKSAEPTAKKVEQLPAYGRNTSEFSRAANSAPAAAGAPPQGAAQTVEVTSESGAVLSEKKDARSVDNTIPAGAMGRAKAPMQTASGSINMQQTANRRAVKQVATAPEASADAFTLEAAPAGSQATWRVNSGRLQHLDPDTGRWNDIGVGTTARLSVVGSAANEVWVGGTTGAMFYSNDSGEHWVPVSTGGWDKNATIIGLTPTARQSVEVHLSNGERWRSADAGASWNKYQ